MIDNGLVNVREQLEATALDWLPRLLTQLDRDPTSITYGCADRDWWHYKIRDFPSIILQQAGYTAWLASSLPAFRDQAEGLRKLAAASALFWASRAKRRGAFEEYYPNEQGYPPLAFSTLAAVKLVAEGAVRPDEIRQGIARAARQLATRFEDKAANQQVAGLAALLWIGRLYPDLVTAGRSSQITLDTLALQTEEGWFPEYDGPDLGYLSVTMDCLWDAYDASGDERFLRSAGAALDFIDAITACGGTKIGMLFSRNTDYILPYGIARFCHFSETREKAVRLLTRLFADAWRQDHFLRAIDDRYVSHYAGHSLLRAIKTLADETAPLDLTMSDVGRSQSDVYFPRSGHFIRIPGNDRMPAIVIALKKGGIATMHAPDGSLASDFGWSLPIKGGRVVSHWWSDHWRSERIENGWRVSGNLVICRDHISRPWKHAVLRMASFLFGRHLKGALKRMMILGTRRSDWTLDREIVWEVDRIVVRDTIARLPPGIEPESAPRASRRYIPSADSYHREDFQPVAGSWRLGRSTASEGGYWKAETIYSCHPPSAM